MKTSVLNHPMISERYFFPRQESFENPYIVKCENTELACYYDNSFSEGKTIVYFYGNGETASDYLNFFPKMFKEQGLNLFIFEYRGYGMSTGRPTLVDILDDVECVIESLNIRQKNLVFYSRSVGTIYAVHAASVFNDVKGLILESGIADVKERIMMRLAGAWEIDSADEELENEFKKYFNTQNKLSKFKGKSLVLHTINDGLVDVSHGKRLYEYLNEPKKINLFERGDHNSIFVANKQEYFEIIFDFIKNL